MMQDIAPSRPGDAETFKKTGLLGPFPLFTREECRKIAAHALRDDLPKPADWWKGRAVSDPFYHTLATDERILSRLRPLLGNDIVLWGVDVLKRKPGQVHPWHCDIESCAPEGGFASVWIGIENISKDSALICLAGSHLYGETIQEVAAGHRLKRGQSTPEMVFDWARERDPNVARIQPDMHDGDAIIFDGRIWHGTHNTRSEGERVALLIQYAAAKRPVHMIDLDYLEWPFRFREDLRPPVMAVSGVADYHLNRVVLPPSPVQDPDPVTRFAKTITLPVTKAADKSWQPFSQFCGATGVLSLMSCHLSVLDAGHSPHPPESHIEEQTIMVLDGEAEVMFGDNVDDAKARRLTLKPGEVSYYSAFEYHEIRNVSERPVTYQIFKWSGGPTTFAEKLSAGIFKFATAPVESQADGVTTRLVFDGPTRHVNRFICRAITLAPDAKFASPAAERDCGIVLLSGEVSTLGHTLRPCGIAYVSAAEALEIRNTGSAGAELVVFEFHAA